MFQFVVLTGYVRPTSHGRSPVAMVARTLVALFPACVAGERSQAKTGCGCRYGSAAR
jgi:hypothetical protein